MQIILIFLHILSYMKRLHLKALFKKYGMITISAWIYAAGISLFWDPNNLAPGGISGISIIVNRLTGIATGSLILLLNIPLLILGGIKFGKNFLCSTFYAILMMSLATDVLALPRIQNLVLRVRGISDEAGGMSGLTSDPLLAALSGGVLVAFALGMVFRAGATTGGMDIIVKLLRMKFPHIRTSAIFLFGDILVVTGSIFVFGNLNCALYAMLSVLTMSLVMDKVLYGGDEAALLYIISEKPAEIAKRILEEMQIGITFLAGKGGYSSREKQIIMCVTKKRRTPRIEMIVKEEDPRAFLIVTRANEIYGEGYKSIFAEKL